MTNPQDVFPDGPNPPQFSALDFMTGVVSLTIGGNDIGFTSIAENCASPTPVGTPCQDRYVVNGHDELRQRIADTAPKIAATLQGIHQHAPRAKIYLIECASDSFADLLDGIDLARTISGVRQISMSFGANEFSSQTTIDSHFVSQNQVFLAAADALVGHFEGRERADKI